MQTREPKKRVNWIFVLILIIAIPLAVIVFVMLNTVSSEVDDTSNGGDIKTEEPAPDTLHN
jgi:hypothetical protein